MKILSEKYALGLYQLIENTNENDLVKEVQGFVDFIIANNDYDQINEIVSEFSKIWDKEKKELVASVSSVYQLSKESKDVIIGYLKKKTNSDSVGLVENIDKNILGGVVLRYADKVIDGSLKNSLNSLKNNINK